MQKERLQILVEPEQRRRLDAAAEQRGISVGAVIRDAIDASLRGSGPKRRIGAVQEMRAAAGGPSPSVEEIHELLDEERAGDPAETLDGGPT